MDELAERRGDQLNIEWKSFLLRVEPKTDDRERFIEYTKSWLRPAETEPKARFTIWSSDNPQPRSSVPAQVAFKLLAEAWPERAAAYHHRLLEAYFSENRDISDGDVLVDLAEEIGVDASEFRDVAQHRTQAMTELVIAEHNSALEQGVTAVPTAVFGGAFPVPGAQPVETYERIVDAIVERQASGES